MPPSHPPSAGRGKFYGITMAGGGRRGGGRRGGGKGKEGGENRDNKWRLLLLLLFFPSLAFLLLPAPDNAVNKATRTTEKVNVD